MKKTVLLLFGAALAVGGLFAACRQGSAPVGQEFTIGNKTEIQSLDPAQIEGTPEARVNLALFEGIVAYDPRTNKEIPAMAESWTISPDGTVITYKLREGLQWSDGAAINAQTVVDSWLYHIDPAVGSKNAYMLGTLIKGADEYSTQGGRREDVQIRALDPRTVEVTLIGPIPTAVQSMAHHSFSPVPLHAIDKYGSNWTQKENFVSNGPFMLEEWTPNSRLVVKANPRYWNRANVHLSKITFLPVEDDSTAYQAYKNGEIDWVTNPPLTMVDQLKLEKDFQVAPQIGTYFYYVNTQHPVLKDPRLRKALSMSFDRQELIDRVIKGGQIPSFSIAPPVGNYKPAAGTGYDVAAAQKLLVDAGYPNGQGLPAFTIMYNTSEAHKVIAEYLQQVWKTTLGINMTLQNIEWATFLEEQKTSRMELARSGWVGTAPDPQTFLELLLSTAGNNAGRYSDPEYDRLVRQAAAMRDGPERDALMRQAEEIAITRDQAVIPIYYYVSQNLINLDKWDGWYPNAADTHPWVGIRKK